MKKALEQLQRFEKHLPATLDPLLPPLEPLRPSAPCPLPTELISYIIDLVYPDKLYHQRQWTFFRTTLVSRAFYRAAKLHLNRELTITKARQFRGLKERLEKEPTLLDNVKVLTLDFDLEALANSLSEDPKGRTWLAPLVKPVLQHATSVEVLNIGSRILCEWHARDPEHDEYSLSHFFRDRTGIALPLLVPSPKLLRLFWTAPMNRYFHHHMGAIEGWPALERVEVDSQNDQAMMEEEHPSMWSYAGAHPGHPLKELIAPFPLMMPACVIAMLNHPVVLQRLDFTLGIGSDGIFSEISTDLTTLFSRLVPTLQHLNLRLKSYLSASTLDISNPIIKLIPTLINLKSLGIGGDIALSRDRIHPGHEAPFLILASLSVTDLHLFVCTLFDFEGDFLTVLKRTEEHANGVGFAKLKRLTVDYSDATIEFMPVESVEICEKRGVELSLCKAV